MAAWTFREKKKNKKVESFPTLFLMFTLIWITEKELERVIAWKQTRRMSFVEKPKIFIDIDDILIKFLFHITPF